MKKIIALALCSALLAGCTDSSGATRALTGAGYHNIHITGWRFFGCDTGKHGSDFYSTGFEADGPTNIHVSGVVCGGIFKGNTIRTD